MPFGDVAPLAGAWIETVQQLVKYSKLLESHPSRVRGLKRASDARLQRPEYVAPLAGAWIETFVG